MSRTNFNVVTICESDNPKYIVFGVESIYVRTAEDSYILVAIEPNFLGKLIPSKESEYYIDRAKEVLEELINIGEDVFSYDILVKEDELSTIVKKELFKFLSLINNDNLLNIINKDNTLVARELREYAKKEQIKKAIIGITIAGSLCFGIFKLIGGRK